MAGNLQRLQEAGIATATPLREPYASVVEELTEQEVAALVSVKRRLADRIDVRAHTMEAAEPAEEFFAAF